MISKEESAKIKKQIISQVEKSNLENKEDLRAQIEKMSSEELENFLKEQSKIKGQGGDCVFCLISERKITSHEIAENEEAIAVLEINPISKGHTIVIPKIHSENHSKKAIELAKEVAENLKTLKPKSIEVIPSSMFGHEIINVLPVYKDETLDSPRKKESDANLSKIKKKIIENYEKLSQKQEERLESPKEKEIITDKTHWLPKRIP